MVTTKNGVLVDCSDARYCSGKDDPNRIDKAVRRSTDSGETWGEYIKVVEEYGKEQNRSSAAIDPVMTYVNETGRIFLHYCHTPAGIGIRNCRCCVGEDSDGNRVINGRFKKYILKNGSLYSIKGKPTAYKVSDNGDVFKNTKKVGNIYTGGRFKEENTSSLMMCYSDDDGETWNLGETPNNTRIINGKKQTALLLIMMICLRNLN